MYKLVIFIGLLGLALGQYPSCFVPKNHATCPHPAIQFWHYHAAMPTGVLLQFGRNPSYYFLRPMPIKVLIHSYTGSRDSAPNCHLRAVMLRIPNVNIITIDYSALVPNLCYRESVQNAHFVGRCLSDFLLSFLTKRMLVPHEIHLIGFGLGAHVAGFAAKFLVHHGFKVGRISALDPAKPHFQTNEVSERLDASDADFVDVIHTDVFVHGLMMPIGHVDFYPNGGIEQPNCGPHHEIKTHLCYAHRSAEYFTESVFSKIGFIAFRCKDLVDYLSGRCQPSSDTELMGYPARPMARGNYFLKTNTYMPFARGPNFNVIDRTVLGLRYGNPELMQRLREWNMLNSSETIVTATTTTLYVEVMPIRCTGPPPFCI